MKSAADWLQELDEVLLSATFYGSAERLIARIQVDAQADVAQLVEALTAILNDPGPVDGLGGRTRCIARDALANYRPQP